MSNNIAMPKEELETLLAELKTFLEYAQHTAGIEDRKKHIISIYKLYGKIESELESKTYWLEQMEMLDEENRKYMERFGKIASCDTIVIKGQKFLMVPVSTPSMPCAGAVFELTEDDPMDEFRAQL